tara:strand:- start:567 stop:788 length:222 start_codon:yes stop_codon:yes gene_type:complete
MRAKRRCMHGKRLRRSPMRKNYDFTKSKDYSPEATKGTIGDKIASAVTPKSMLDLVPTTKLVKAGKAIYNYFT